MGGNSTKKLTQEYLSELCHLLPDKENYDFTNTIYKNSRSNIKITCNLHGDFEIKINSLKRKYSCKVCDYLSNRYTPELSLNEYKMVALHLHKNNYDYCLIDENNFNDEKIPVICKEHGKFMIRKSAHISSSQLYGCQKCSRGYSKTENYIEDWLIKNNIEYTYQKTFNDLIGGSNQHLPFDFLIHKPYVLLEFDGIHHRKPVKFGKDQTEESQLRKYRQIVKNDSIKNRYVIDNGLTLVRITYTRITELYKILENEFLGMNNHLDETPWLQFYSNSEDEGFLFKVYI
jgi:hypothetical protein